MTLRKSDRIFVAGHKGLVGSAIAATLEKSGYENILVRDRSELDLSKTEEVHKFFKTEKPDCVFLAAAKVGGIHANNVYRADFIYQNLQIQNNVIWEAHCQGTRRLVFLGSSCIYPRDAAQPITESSLLTGPLEQTNKPYAVAKIAGVELVESLRRQYKRDYFSVMPTNLFGPGDNFDLENSHVLPALIRKIVIAKHKGAKMVEIWGTGKPLREFMYSLDCADAIVHLAEHCEANFFDGLGFSHINIGTNEELSIRRLAEVIQEIVGYKGALKFDLSRPDGTPKKLMDASLLHSTGWTLKRDFPTSLRAAIDWYVTHEFSKNLKEEGLL